MTVWTVPAIVRRVIDGDTLVADLDLGWRVWRIDERIRLRGIDCPEKNTPEGQTAWKFAAGALGAFAANPGAELEEPVTVTSTGLDKYGRVLGVVRLRDGRLLNDLILDAGHAVRA